MVIQLTENKKENHLNKITISLDTFSSKYKNVLLMGDFNSEPIEEIMSNFMELYDLKKKLSPCAYMLQKSREPFLY